MKRWMKRQKWDVTLLMMMILCEAASLPAAQRTFLMGTTPFFADTTDFPDWKFENLNDKDVISLHVDDFLGIPWTSFQNNTTPPASWVSRVTSLANAAAATHKVLYLALTPISGSSGRKSLVDRIEADGSRAANWATVDSSGCYTFSSDLNAVVYKTAYINYVKYMVRLYHPQFLTPAIEMNVEFTGCPAQKAGWISWYSDVHNALKAAYPDLPVFPTFQMEHLYGILDPAPNNCLGPVNEVACFDQRLPEAVAIPADRIAFSMYPFVWKYQGRTFPYEETFVKVQAATQRRIWVGETGYQAVPIYETYQHATPSSSCGSLFFGPDKVGALDIADDAALEDHLTRLLNQAQSKDFEAVIWWLDRDYLDSSVAGTCPCVGANETCTLLDNIYQAGGVGVEKLFRLNGNMGLHYYNGTPRPAYAAWLSYHAEPILTNTTAEHVEVYPNPLRPALGHTGMNFTQLPSGARLRIYTLAGEKVNDLTADALGHTVWDGTNQARQKAASGVYIVDIQGAGDKKTLKVAIQR